MILVLFVLLVVLSKVLKNPAFKGWSGEKAVSVVLRKLEKHGFRILNDIMLPAGEGTTQIDHVVVSRFGVFVIETKNYKGWIYTEGRRIGSGLR